MKLVAVIIGSKRHIDLLRAGYRTHHVEGNITYLEFLKGGDQPRQEEQRKTRRQTVST